MLKPGILEFAKLLVREVRDRAVNSCDNLLDPRAENVIARRWRSKIENGSPEELAATVIPDCVDDTLFQLLHAIDEGLIRLSFVSSSGEVVDLTSDGDGELGGWYMATGGLRGQFSGERFVDDFANLS